MKRGILHFAAYAAIFTFAAPSFFTGKTALVFAEKTPSAVSQTVIDELTDKAYYVLNSAADPASGLSPEQAVAAAKAIAEQMRTLAQNDLNKNYILAKASELDGQIYLEEKGLLLEKEQWKEKNVTALVAQFNAALGQARPSFAALGNIERQIALIAPAKGTEATASIKKRAAVLARDVPTSLETLLKDGKLDSARTELVYCQVNGADLGFSEPAYAALEAKVAAKATLEDERSLIANSLDRFRTTLAAGDLADASKERQFAGGKIAALRTRMVPHEWDRFNKDFELLDSKLRHREDSLCAVALSRLRASGPSAASAFLDTLTLRGVSPERIGRIDHQILEAVVAQKKLESPDSGIVPAAPDSAGGANALSDILAAARKAAAEKSDSLSCAQTERGRSTQVDEVRKDRLRVAYTLWKLRDEKKQTTEKQLALQELVDIYTSLELHKPADAYQHFSKSRDFLQKNLPAEDFVKVTATVQRQYDAKGKL